MHRIEPPGLKKTDTVGRSTLTVSRTAILILAACVLSGFGGSGPEIPKPNDPLAPPPPVPPVEQSVVHLQVNLALNDLAFAADAAVPREGAQDETWQDGGTLTGQGPYHYLYRFARGPLHVRMVQHHLVTEFPEVRYRFAVRITKPGSEVVEDGCAYGDGPPNRVRLSAVSRLSWSEEWTLKSETSFDPPRFLDPCRLTTLDIDGTPIVQSLLEPRLRALATAIDAKVRERTEAKKRAETVWRKLQEPAALTPNLWLSLNPTGAQVGPISSDGDRLIQTSVNLILRPMAGLGPHPPATTHPLPSIELIPRSLDGLHLALSVLADYPAINRLLAQRLVGNEIPNSVGDPLRIVSAQLYGSGASLILELGMSGGINGTLYATGTPVLDATTQMLRFEQFNFTVETKNVLLRTADRLMHDDLLSRLEPETRIDLSEQLGTLRRQLSRALTRQLSSDTWLEGSVTSLQPRAIYPVPGGVEIQVIADGALRLSVR